MGHFLTIDEKVALSVSRDCSSSEGGIVWTW